MNRYRITKVGRGLFQMSLSKQGTQASLYQCRHRRYLARRDTEGVFTDTPCLRQISKEIATAGYSSRRNAQLSIANV